MFVYNLDFSKQFQTHHNFTITTVPPFMCRGLCEPSSNSLHFANSPPRIPAVNQDTLITARQDGATVGFQQPRCRWNSYSLPPWVEEHVGASGSDARRPLLHWPRLPQVPQEGPPFRVGFSWDILQLGSSRGAVRLFTGAGGSCGRCSHLAPWSISSCLQRVPL